MTELQTHIMEHHDRMDSRVIPVLDDKQASTLHVWIHENEQCDHQLTGAIDDR